jgi:hypothetical protein
LNIAPPQADPETGLAALVGDHRLLRLAAACLMSIWIIGDGVVSARAGVRLEGSPEALQIEAVDAKLVDVLNELKAKFNLRYRANDALEARITGSFRGSLQGVVARLLEGYDYVIAISPDGLDALILPQNATANALVAKLPPAMLQPAASPPVMTAREAKRAR